MKRLMYLILLTSLGLFSFAFAQVDIHTEHSHQIVHHHDHNHDASSHPENDKKSADHHGKFHVHIYEAPPLVLSPLFSCDFKISPLTEIVATNSTQSELSSQFTGQFLYRPPII